MSFQLQFPVEKSFINYLKKYASLLLL